MIDFKMDVSKKNKEELGLIKAKLEDYFQEVNMQINIAKQKAYNTGEYADPLWFEKIQQSKYMAVKFLAKINARFTQLKEQNKKKGNNFAECFFRTSREELSEDIFMMLMEKTSNKLKQYDIINNNGL